MIGLNWLYIIYWSFPYPPFLYLPSLFDLLDRLLLIFSF